MKLRTELNPKSPAKQIALSDPLFLTGSCFSENIGSLLNTYKFNTLVNPFGTIYNPVSIFRLLDQSMDQNPAGFEHGIIYNQGTFRHFDFHSGISSPDREKLLKQSYQSFRESNDFIKNAGWIIITFGTSVIYRYKESGEIVANCHKIPSQKFDQLLLTVDEITGYFDVIFEKLKKFNPGISVILTVSPVRHLRDGFEMNQVSKSVLRIACERIINKHTDVDYFPAYELMIDDLRDYRFYKEDMVHPNESAVKYIWEKFCITYFDPSTLQFIADWEKILSAIRHRPFHPGTEEHKDFIRKTLKQLDKFRDLTDISAEKRILEEQL